MAKVTLTYEVNLLVDAEGKTIGESIDFAHRYLGDAHSRMLNGSIRPHNGMLKAVTSTLKRMETHE